MGQLLHEEEGQGGQSRRRTGSGEAARSGLSVTHGILLRRMLNAELERKYGASLSGSQGAGTSLVRSKMSSSHLKAHSMPPMFAEDDVSDIDQKLKGTDSQEASSA